jgi:hypothetical protein
VGHWYVVDHVGGIFVALGHGDRVAVSANGVTWTEHPVPTGSWQSLSYGDGRFVALSSLDSGVHEMISTNGVVWTPVPGPPGPWTGVTFGSGRFVAVSAVGQIITSINGVDWTTTWVHSKFHFTSIAYGNGRYIAVDDAQGDDLISLNGLGWSFYPITTVGQRWHAVTFGDGNFAAFNTSTPGEIATSVLGYVWSVHHNAAHRLIDAATYGCNEFAATGPSSSTQSYFLTSATAAQWSSASLTQSAPTNWTSMTYGAFRFVAVDSSGRIASWHIVSNCSYVTAPPPRDVSGNLPAAGQVWTYVHPPLTSGGAPIDSYQMSLTADGVTRRCHAAVYYQPNCIISGLRDHVVYELTTQSHNRFGYSVGSDPQWVIPVASRSLEALTMTPVVRRGTPVEIQLTGVAADSQGIYPTSWVTIHFGSRLYYCQPSPFGQCLITVSAAPVGTTAIWANYVGYGRAYRSAPTLVTVTP